MKVRAPSAEGRYYDVRKLLHGASLTTVCEEARCPNIAECWGKGTATFQILGDTCTRACRYCYVNSGKPEHAPDPLEPLRLAQAAATLGVRHVVVTSVDRDDLPDRGAGHFAATIRALRARVPGCSIEILTPDFVGAEEAALAIVLDGMRAKRDDTTPMGGAAIDSAIGSDVTSSWSLTPGTVNYLNATVDVTLSGFENLVGGSQEDNFLIDKSDSIVALLLDNLKYLTGAAALIGLITLVGAAVGLMNIMLVAVTERTKEIGLIKAVGGKQKAVRRQFLYESIIISLLGASFGIVLGIIVGNSFSLVLDTGFVIPWGWIIKGIIICSVVGLLAGLYPAIKASRLNPIEALRYE